MHVSIAAAEATKKCSGATARQSIIADEPAAIGKEAAAAAARIIGWKRARRCRRLWRERRRWRKRELWRERRRRRW
jgi:hypothetical protein